MTIKKSLYDFHNSQDKLVTNLVFMGQGNEEENEKIKIKLR
jgi:hypothetical protein